MGLLIDGEWRDKWYDTESTGGKFERSTSKFRNWVTADGSAGPSGKSGFQAQSGRYHLYVSYACPWAHRALIFRALKDLTDHISVSVVHPDMMEDGWTFATDFEGATGDTLFGSDFLRDIYIKADPNFTGRVTVPVLWDKAQNTIVSNESAEIIRMFNSAFNEITGNTDDYWPTDLREQIADINERVYETVNNGVYKAGFATSQDAYDDAVHPLFDSLAWLESILENNRFLAGDKLTEADWRLFTTLARFDLVYHTHFKCNHKRLTDYPNLWAYTRQLYQHADIAETVHFDHIVRHYHFSQTTVNPHQIIPINPTVDFTAPHGRD
ncbi:glutathione S-transferase family protein [Sulfitobacter pontiacus]|jgi:putative glutathione S-transferase|uniref:glutathione S-transferase family protein n=1 Tax=Sulfitobacter pontiacus TaxID=60137 RepID=UPI000C4393C0|nr:glutathione S-transferase family protein [Sulfitobacter pontiacus]MAX75150.1 glutathione-dependent reductase [Roseobacter sp.]HCJ00656.1 glutathione-dependent reductase [Sulfitobacter sp.]HJO51419.1 glutathione S-transferase family protein [Sulfitobacter pontiacus]|tara:strand:- start:999 stop:1973 length:975 start_codon:yes stop_codon:yes gene_type:complete